MKKNFLSIETSINRIFLVLFVNQSLTSVEKIIKTSIEVSINNLLMELFTSNKSNFTDLDYVLISVGPGSYTGTRVGLAAAKAIALSIKKPLIGYSNFIAMYYQGLINEVIERSVKTGILIKANKNEYFFQSIENFYCGKPHIYTNENLKKRNRFPKFLIGNLETDFKIDRYYKCLPCKESILKISKSIEKNKNNIKLHNIEPLYIRGHYAK